VILPPSLNVSKKNISLLRNSKFYQNKQLNFQNYPLVILKTRKTWSNNYSSYGYWKLKSADLVNYTTPPRNKKTMS
jgi:hypothetical protein